MWHNYLILTLRNLLRHKLHSFINIAGLSTGIAVSILIYLFIQDELSFDQFHAKKDRILRIEAIEYSYGEEHSYFDTDKDGVWTIAWMPTILGPTMKEEIPEVARMTRWDGGSAIVTYKEKIFEEYSVIHVDPDFFLMFDFELLKGDPHTVLEDKSHIVIAEKIADKYFGEEDPMGKAVILNLFGEDQSYIVSGVIKNAPENSSLDYSMLLRQEARPYYKENADNWKSFNTPTFVELSEQAGLAQFRDNLAAFENKYFAEKKKERRERDQLDEEAKIIEMSFTPLTGIHLDNDVSWHKSSDPAYAFILGAIGILILLIASINYISLSLSSSSGRSREVGIRKVLGANQRTLRQQFLGESQLLVFLALVAGIFLAYVFLEPFNNFTKKSLTLFSLSNAGLILFLVILALLVGFAAGGYPALYLSRFNPVKVLKSRSSNKFNTGMTRVLVVVQYAISGFLIISSVIMYRQMNYITSKDLGYNKDQVLVFRTFTGRSEEGEKSVNRLRNELTGDPDIRSVSGVSTSFNQGWSNNSFGIDGELHNAFTYRVDPGYIKTLDLRIIKGRNFDPGRVYDTKNAILVNEALVRDFDWEDPLSEKLYWRSDSSSAEIIGVLKDYHFLSLEEKIAPLILHINPDNGKITTALVKIGSSEIPKALDKVEKTWKTLYPDKPFEYSFLDDDISRQYANYDRWMNIMSASTILAILIACLGLFGLAGINALNRIKEISIRKVLGAEIPQIFMLMNKDVVILAIISFIIATPVSYYIMTRWLESFVYKIDVEWPLFLASLIIGILIAVISVSYHAVRAALVNPAEILKDE